MTINRTHQANLDDQFWSLSSNFSDIYELLLLNPLNYSNTLQKIYQMKSNNCLSLQKWPHYQASKSNDHRKLSPLTSKIFTLTKTNAHDLMHISIQQFSMSLTPQLKDIRKIHELYQQEINYRSNKLKLLKSIWKKSHKQIVSSYSLANSTSETLLTSRFLNHSKNLTKSKSKTSLENHKLTKSKTKKKNSVKENHKKNISPFYSIKNKKKSSQCEYFQNFSRKSKDLSNAADQSTKSKKNLNKYLQRMKKSASPNEDYYENSMNNKSRQIKLSGQTAIRGSQNREQDMLQHKVYDLLERFSVIFEKQIRQNEQGKNLSCIERKRLNKLQRMQQISLITEIDQTCNYLSSLKALKKNH